MKILFKVTFLLLASALSFLGNAQERKEWRVTGDNAFNENGIDVIVGNVRAVKEGAVITCDRAESYKETNTVKLTGSVILTKEGTKLYATEIIIDRNTDIADIRNNTGYVRVLDKNGTELKSPLMKYHVKDDIFRYFNGGVIKSKDYVLESEVGSYYEKLGVVYIKNKVQVLNKDYLAVADSASYNQNTKITKVFGNTVFWHSDGILTAKRGEYNENSQTFRLYENSYALSKENQAWADSIVYNKGKELMYLGRNICLLDTANHGALVADYGFVDRNREYAFATKKAAAITFQPKEDTLFLRADTLMVYNLRNKHVTTKDSLIRFAKALHNVRYFREDLQGACDSLVYTTKDSVMFMYGVPLIWNEQNQISADSITIFTKNQKVDRAELILNSFITQKETDKYFNQIKGRAMTVFFNDKNKISYVNVKGNGQTVYFVKDSTSIEGVNLATSSGIGIKLEDGKVDKMTFRTKPESNMYPLDKIEENQLKLKGFKWTPESRPASRFEISTKEVKKSRADEVNAIPQPTFPTYLRIYGKKLDTTMKKSK